MTTGKFKEAFKTYLIVSTVVVTNGAWNDLAFVLSVSLFQEFTCDVSLEDGKKPQPLQFSFTLYDLDGHGKITKDVSMVDDLCKLVF